MPKFKTINSTKAPMAIGPYCQGIAPQLPGMPVFLSGQIGIDPKSGELVSDEIKGQTKQVFENIKAVLAEVNLTLNDVVRIDIFLENLNDYASMNKIYAEEFKNHKPARATVATKELPQKAKVEIIATAWKEIG